MVKDKKLKLKLCDIKMASENGWHPLWFDENMNGSCPWDNFYCVEYEDEERKIQRANSYSPINEEDWATIEIDAKSQMVLDKFINNCEIKDDL